MHDDEFEAIRKLIRLKRHENPGEGFTEDFLREFHRRKREVHQGQSRFTHVLEGLGDRFEALLRPKWSFAAAAAAAFIVLLAVFLNELNKEGQASTPSVQTASQLKDAPKDASSKKSLLQNKPQGAAIPASHEKKARQ
jgi:hypothetical protein